MSSNERRGGWPAAPPDSQQVSIRLRRDTIRQLDKLAHERGGTTSRSDLVREAVERFLAVEGYE